MNDSAELHALRGAALLDEAERLADAGDPAGARDARRSALAAYLLESRTRLQETPEQMLVGPQP